MVETKETKISAGSYDLNRWLYGGYEKDVITMIAGSPGSGKTNFVILVACSQAKKGNKVIFVDTEGGFSVERVKQIAPEEHEKILENILILSPTSFEEQKKCFFTLLKNVKDGNIGVIVIDSMVMHYRLELGDAIKENDDRKIQEINREVAKQMRALSEISRRQNIPIIITNQVYSEFLSEEDLKNGVQKTTNLVGGDLLKYWSKCIIELKNDRGKRKAVLLKHRSLPESEFYFDINNAGVKKRGIF
jgi:DNA repair protein RadB